MLYVEVICFNLYVDVQSYSAPSFVQEQLLHNSKLLQIKLLRIVMQMEASRRFALANAAAKPHASAAVQKGMLVLVISTKQAI